MARARRRQLAGRIGTAALGLTVLAIAGAAGTTALQHRQGSASAAARSVETSRGEAASGSAEQRQPPVQEGPAAQQGVAATPSAPAPTATSAAQPLAPIISEGRTELVEGMYALRAGGNIEVHFDTPATRTRRADKFERIVRTTLPLVYGAAADSLLANTPPGQIATADRLLTELPRSGVRLALASGWSLVLHPGTRPGQDGPLVVTYRAIVTR